MEDSLKLSILGLKRIDQARKLKGWNRQSSSWAQAALTTVSTLKQFWRRERVQRETFIRICEAVDLPNWRELADTRPQQTTIADWSEAPEVHFFCDRQLELAQLERWILDDKAKLVSVLGLGGMGKTTLTVKLIEQIHAGFEYVIWRSLHSTPTLKDLLLELIHFFSSPQQRPMNRLRRLLARHPEIQPPIFSHLEEQDTAALLALLMSQLREHRCLMVLDGLDSLLNGFALESPKLGAELRLGEWKPDAAGYQQFLQRLSQERHQSCLLVISREPPKGLTFLDHGLTPTLYLKGLSDSAGESLVKKTGSVTATPAQWRSLVRYYDGNPLMLKVVADVVCQFMEGDLSQYLQQITEQGFTPTAISDWLDDHLIRLDPAEREVLEVLAIAAQPLTLEELQPLVVTPQVQTQVINHLATLERRSLLHHEGKMLSLSPVIQTHLRARYAKAHDHSTG